MRVSRGKANTPERLAYAGESSWYPAISRHGNHLAFMRRVGGGSEIWRVESPTRTKRVGPPVKMIYSTQDDEEPEYSPDGRQIVFKSNRSGRLEIWVSKSDGSNPLQLTHAVSNTFLARWAPDGRNILFTSNPDGHNDLFLIDSQGGVLRRLTRACPTKLRRSIHGTASGSTSTPTERVKSRSGRCRSLQRGMSDLPCR